MTVLTYAEWKSTHEPVTAFTPQRVSVEHFPLSEFSDDRRRFTDPSAMVGFHLSGPCPACGHSTRAVCATKYLAQNGTPATVADRRTRAGLGVDETEVGPSRAASTKTLLTVMKCACIHTHEKSPGGFGCGAEWLLRVTYAPTEPRLAVKKEPVPEAEAVRCWPAADLAGAAIPNSLTTAQSAATKWQGALTALVALVGVAAALSGRDTIQGLEDGWKAVLIVALVAALVSNGVMLYKGDLASIGFPAIKPAESTDALEDDDLVPLEAAAASVHSLQISFRWMLATVVASVVAVSVFLFAPSTTPANRPAMYKVTELVGKVVTTTPCGVFTPALPLDGRALPPTLTFTPHVRDASSVAISSAQVQSIAGC